MFRKSSIMLVSLLVTLGFSTACQAGPIILWERIVQFGGSTHKECLRAGRVQQNLNNKSVTGYFSQSTRTCTLIIWLGGFFGAGELNDID